MNTKDAGIVRLLCNYCNHLWKEYFTDQDEMDYYGSFLRCPKCASRYIKVIQSKDVFGYNYTEER